MGDWLTLTQIARYWNVSEDEARQILLDHKKRPPKPSGQMRVEQDFLDQILQEREAAQPKS
jgi:hypothetical protein